MSRSGLSSFGVRFWLAVLVIAIGVQLLVGGPRGNLWWSAVFDAGHTPLFGLVALAALRMSASFGASGSRSRIWHYGLALVVAVLVGVVTEAAQVLGPRDADLGDLIRDMEGAAAFLLLHLAWELRTSARRWSAPALLGLGLLVHALWPVASLGVAYLQRNAAFPRICDFEHGWERRFAIASDAELELVAAPEAWEHDHGRVGRLMLLPAVYPGLQIMAPFPDWRGHDRLLLDVYSEADSADTLEMRINDRHHDQTYHDRFNRSLFLHPGLNEIVVQLSQVEQAPRGRVMDMSGIRNLTIFAYRQSDTLVVFLDSVRLE